MIASSVEVTCGDAVIGRPEDVSGGGLSHCRLEVRVDVLSRKRKLFSRGELGEDASLY